MHKEKCFINVMVLAVESPRSSSPLVWPLGRAFWLYRNMADGIMVKTHVRQKERWGGKTRRSQRESP